MRRLLKYVGEYKKYAIWSPVLMAVEVVFDVLIPSVMGMIIDNGIYCTGEPDIRYIIRMGLVMVAMSVAAMLFGGLSGYIAAHAGAGFVLNLRKAVFNKIQDFSFANIDHFSVPSLVTRVTTDMRQIRMAFMNIIRLLVRCPLMLIFSFIQVARINLRLAIIFVIAIPVLSLGFFWIHSTAHPRFQVMMEKYDKLNAALEENLVGIRVVKTFVRGAFEKKKFKTASDGVRDQQRFAEAIVILNQPFFELVMYACIIAVSWFGGKAVINETMTMGDFTEYISYIKMVLFSLLMISSAIMMVVLADSSIDRVCEILDEEIDITDEDADPSLKVEEGSIEFENVSFKYDKNAEKFVLADVNLKINPGETVGIIGSTGSSKSTLISLVSRLYDTTEGAVKVGGRNVKDYTLRNLRDQVAVVLQKNVLFSGTIEENLKWGDPDATHEQVVEAAKCAQADDFISSFPDGYNTMLEQGGVNVSGGQQQRLCIARALLRKPKIIIMDDSTSAVDTDTDRRIRAALKEKLSGMTTIIIAQRIASVMDADKIVVMDDGRIKEVGNHEQLMKTSEIYNGLYTSQMQGVQA